MITPSTTLVTMPVDEVIIKSKIWRPGVKLAVFAEVIESVISPLALPVTVDVMILYDDE
jgi:hypothetical protein